jgi:hypothetical protein
MQGGRQVERETSRNRVLSDTQLDSLNWGDLRDWGQLVRLPNVFTLFSDCLAAAVVAVGSVWPLSAMVPVVLASLCAYWAGMILNDVVDLEEDRQARPHRPLASGRISPVIAGHVATGMLLVGPIFILVAMTLHTSQPLWMGAAFLTAVLLSLAVRSYDSPIKRTLLGPPLMGVCRMLNILMVGVAMLAVNSGVSNASLSLEPRQGSEELAFAVEGRANNGALANPVQEPVGVVRLPEKSFPKPLLALAIGIGIYIFGVTVYARREEQDSSQGVLVMGILLEVVGLAIIALLPSWAVPDQRWTLNPAQGYPLLIALIGLTVVNRGVAGVLHPVPRKVQLAVKHAILTLILVDAAVVLMWAGPWYGCAVVLLLLPALSSAVRFRST